MVQDYRRERERRVLTLVKRYPLYSLNKLAEEFPDMSRRSIQNILEKNKLSTMEERVSFSRRTPKKIIDRLKPAWRGLSQFFSQKGVEVKEGLGDWLEFERRKVFGVAALSVLLFAVLIQFFWAKRPFINLLEPEENAVILDQHLFLKGTVEPRNVKIEVNGQEVSYNGNGNFTAVITLEEGPNVLKVLASSLTKTSEVSRLVHRQLTEEEMRRREEEKAKAEVEEERKRQEEEGKLTAEVKAVEARGGVRDETGVVEIVKQEVRASGGVAIVVGEVINKTGQPLAYIHVLATFFDKTGEVVDVKYGSADFEGDSLAPGARASFETKLTLEDFKDYTVDLVWGKR